MTMQPVAPYGSAAVGAGEPAPAGAVADKVIACNH